MAKQFIPLAVGNRIRRDYNTNITSPVVQPATDRYRRNGWFVTLSDDDSTGTFYYMRRDGKVQAAGSGYPTPRTQVTVEVL